MSLRSSSSSALSAAPNCLLIDSHTHFDDPSFEVDRDEQIDQALAAGVRHLLLVGYLQQYFSRLRKVQAQINSHRQTHASSSSSPNSLQAHVALGLHPFYIDQHSEDDCHDLASRLRHDQDVIAIGEIGLDTYLPSMKDPAVLAKQRRYFQLQLDLAIEHDLPVLLHIRKSHADCLRILKQHAYDAKKLGGIAHSFSGGEQEAKAFVKLGFKLGVTGQVTNPNAKKLRRALTAAVQTYGLSCLVIETDCPDMMPVPCQQRSVDVAAGSKRLTRNTPANLPYVLTTLSEMFSKTPERLARQLWSNTCEALKVDWAYLP